MSNSLYDLLEVSPNASAELIHSAYRVRAQRWHPDKNLEDPGAADMMAQINRAYAILSDPIKRRNYDASLPSAPRSPSGYHATNPGFRGSSSFPPRRKSAHKADPIKQYFSMAPFVIIGLICFMAIGAYLVFFYTNDGAANANAELVRLQRLIDSVPKGEQDAK